MKREIAQLRRVLLDVEAQAPVAYHAIGHPSGVYHAALLAQAGYITVVDGEPDTILMTGVTWSGHKLLDQLRNEQILDQAQDAAESTVGDRDNLDVVLRYIERFSQDV